jgi:ABC-type sugar transport system substrate-binding protein
MPCSRTRASRNHDLRVTALIAYMEENYPNMKLVGRQATNQDSNAAYRAVRAMLQANPNLGGVVDPGGRFGRRCGRGRARSQCRQC